MRCLMEIPSVPQHGQGGIPYSPFSGVAEAAFYCAHRTRHNNVAPSKLVRSLSPGDGGLIDLPLRASNEGLLRPRVARAQKIIRPHPSSFLTAPRPFVTLRADCRRSLNKTKIS